MKIAVPVYRFFELLSLAWDRYLISKIKRSMLGSVGSNVRIGIGAHSVIAAGAVVTKNVAPYTVYGGSAGKKNMRSVPT